MLLMRQMRFASPAAAATVETATALETSDMEASAEGRSCVDSEGPRYTAAVEAVVGPIAHADCAVPRATIESAGSSESWVCAVESVMTGESVVVGHVVVVVVNHVAPVPIGSPVMVAPAKCREGPDPDA
jgi:hypothetical protein